MIDWKQKLASRRFWTAIGGFVTAILIAFKIDQLTIEQVVAVVAAIGTLMVYIYGESSVDAQRAANPSSAGGDDV